MLVRAAIPRYIDRVNVWREWRRPRSELAWAIVAFVIFYAIFVGVTLNSDGTGTAASQLMMSSVDKIFQSTSSAIAGVIRKNKAKIKYNSYLYLIDTDNSKNK